MISVASYYKGHRGAVTALAKADSGNSFFSSGSEGLIVRWQLNKPNQGEIITKLPGYVSAMGYCKQEKLIFATLNHKGLYCIEALSGKVIKFMDIPATSFKKID
jgi:hypothetical protein